MNPSHEAAVSRLTRCLDSEIPLTSAMQVSVGQYDGSSLAIEAPLSPNRNHKATAFGGSLYSLSVVSCWGLLLLRLWQEEFDCEIVIQKASANYFLPVGERIVAVCELSDERAWQRLTSQIARRGRGRIALESEIRAADAVAFRLCGYFVAALGDKRR